ncbi:hypothetical protein MAR_024755 [Mya arenaria]|uniref:Uncharacterized protein n=1 Tax=Mya arenaria TaxID=6604 RepID=A0ABY7DUN1_MYAAR|nr:hypothetical protein MAR_024755 [Mya arenaria]
MMLSGGLPEIIVDKRDHGIFCCHKKRCSGVHPNVLTLKMMLGIEGKLRFCMCSNTHIGKQLIVFEF